MCLPIIGPFATGLCREFELLESNSKKRTVLLILYSAVIQKCLNNLLHSQ